MKNTKKAAVAVLAGALAIGGATMALAADQGNGQWCNGSAGVAADTTWKNSDGQTVSSWWFAVSEDGSECLANTWHWIKNSDGNICCYYFDKDGWMVVDATIDGDSVDENGRYVDADGTVVTGDDSNTYYTSSTTFLSTTGSSATTETAETTSTTDTADTSNTSGTAYSSASEEGGPGTTSSNGQVYSTKDDDVVKTKGSSSETPDAVSVGFTLSSVTGSGTSYSIVNHWADYALDLDGYTFEKGDGNSYMDFWAANDDSEISVMFYPISIYGGSSFSSFLSSYTTTTRGQQPGAVETGVTNVTVGDDVNFGGYTYKQVVRTYKRIKTTTESNSSYLREIPGTGYVMEIYTKGSTDSFASILSTMSKAN